MGMAVGEKKQLKRISSFHQKRFDKLSGIYISKIKQGNHSKIKSISLFQLVKGFLKFSGNHKQVKRLIKSGFFYVNKKKCEQIGFPIGLMDNITIPKIKKNYKLFVSRKGQLKLFKTSFWENDLKLSKISSISSINRHCRLITTEDKHTIRYSYRDVKIDDSILFTLTDNKVVQIIHCKIGALVIITNGSNKGQIGKIFKITNNFNFEKTLHLALLNGQKITKNVIDTLIIGEHMIPFISLNERIK